MGLFGPKHRTATMGKPRGLRTARKPILEHAGRPILSEVLPMPRELYSRKSELRLFFSFQYHYRDPWNDPQNCVSTWLTLERLLYQLTRTHLHEVYQKVYSNFSPPPDACNSHTLMIIQSRYISLSQYSH